MRKYVIAGNWKMNNTISESVSLISNLKNGLNEITPNCDIIICPPFLAIETAQTLVKGSKIKLGAQNFYYEENGAYTGEISTEMLVQAGCEYVLVGHSERRTIFNENDEVVNLKLKKALSKGLKPILCVGETLEQREQNITNNVIKKQVTDGLKDVSQDSMENIIVAYEPVWAIGTGKTASPEQAQEVHAFIRGLVSDLYNSNVSENLTIQYGGSVKPDNAKELLSQNDIDGALVGGACLKADSFLDIIKSC